MTDLNVDPDRPRVRNGDPQTSEDAVPSAEDISQCQQDVIVLFWYWPRMTDKQLVRAAEVLPRQWSPSGLRSRRRELTDKGYILRMWTREGPSGRERTVWRLDEKGEQAAKTLIVYGDYPNDRSDIDPAPPGVCIWDLRPDPVQVRCKPEERPDANMKELAKVSEYCFSCGNQIVAKKGDTEV